VPIRENMDAITTNKENDMDLTTFDLIVINTSGGKDSQTLMKKIVDDATAAGVLDRVIAVHAELEEEWAGTKELVAEQALAHDIPIRYVKRSESLLSQIEKRGMWPSNKARFCTSDHKRDQINKVIVAESNALNLPRKVQVLNCLGIRAQESSARAKKTAVQVNKRLSNTKRTVTEYLAIFDWTEEQVWIDIKASGVRYHHAYDLGMPRLSCCFCVFAGRDALLLAGHHNKPLLKRYADLEGRIGHTFRKELPIVTVLQAVENGEQPAKISTWAM
jgi:3'-phosphoadenosine 5'-phosphosulfate sulfotransferase (PAPS reductase)/FAD synthetase